MYLSKILGGKAGGCEAMMLWRLLLAAVVFPVAAVAMAQNAPATATAKPHSAYKSARNHTKVQAAPAPMPQPETPPQPEAPKWPVNDAPSRPAVTWNSQGLRIQATNASLSRILTEVSTQTGAKIEGLSGDERVFGDFGPGEARDVLTQLLHGSSYNFLLLGDQGRGTPREVILSAQRTGPAGQSGAGYNRQTPDQSGDDDSVPDQPEEDPTQGVPMPPPPQPEQMNPQGALTPQQRLQMMQQQRMQQLQQMQQQNQQQPQQPQ